MKKTADVMSKIGKWLLVFGFIFSEVSFPLEVLADELINDENTYQEVVVDENTGDLNQVEFNEEEPVIKVNGEETTEYTITENTEVTVVLEYQGETKTEVLDFSKKLYGTYQYTFENVEEVVIINYLGNNADLLKQYANVSELTKKITCDGQICVISGFGVDLVTVADVKAYYNLVDFGTNYSASVVVTDGENSLLDTDTLLNDYLLEIVDNQSEIVLDNGVLVNTTPSSSYTINRVGDVFVPSDGLIDVKDQEAVLEDVLQGNEATNMNDVNGDGVLNILDATHSTYLDTDLVEGEVTDVLTNTLIADVEELLVGETLEVKLLVSGFDKLSLYGIEGILTYDESILKLVGASLYALDEETEDLGYLNLENGKFAYILRNGFNNSEEAVLTLQFEALVAGMSEVTVSDLIESYGEAFEVSNDTATVNITVLEDGTGGDVEEDTPVEEDKTEGETKEDTDVETEVVVRPVVLSSDYYIKTLTIDGYELDFNMYTYDYSIKVKNDVTSLDFDVLLNNGKSIYWVEGNENFKEGENLVYLVVKAENGSTKTYTIRVEKEKAEVVKDNATELEEEDIENEENNTSKTIIIILIILVIIGLIYVIFKDDEEDKKEVKKTSQPEKVKSEEVKIREVKNNSTKNTNNTKNNASKTGKNNKKNNKK